MPREFVPFADRKIKLSIDVVGMLKVDCLLFLIFPPSDCGKARKPIRRLLMRLPKYVVAVEFLHNRLYLNMGAS
jgi:hypothetical protein